MNVLCNTSKASVSTIRQLLDSWVVVKPRHVVVYWYYNITNIPKSYKAHVDTDFNIIKTVQNIDLVALLLGG